jgi:hypothetical protein
MVIRSAITPKIFTTKANPAAGEEPILTTYSDGVLGLYNFQSAWTGQPARIFQQRQVQAAIKQGGQHNITGLSQEFVALVSRLIYGNFSAIQYSSVVVTVPGVAQQVQLSTYSINEICKQVDNGTSFYSDGYPVTYILTQPIIIRFTNILTGTTQTIEILNSLEGCCGGDPGAIPEGGACYSDYLFWDPAANFGAGGWLVGSTEVHLGCNSTTLDALSGIAIGNVATSSNSSAIAIGPTTTASGASSLVVGSGSTSTGARAITLGRISNAVGDDSIAIGSAANTAAAESAIAIGTNTVSAAESAIAIGGDDTVNEGANASGVASIALGANSDATQDGAIAIGGSLTNGGGAEAGAINAISIGVNSTSSSSNSVAVGNASTVNATSVSSVAIGDAAVVGPNASQGIAIGMYTRATAQAAVAIGGDADLNQGAFASANSTIAIGANSIASGVNSVAIGSSLNNSDGANASGISAIAIGSTNTAGDGASAGADYAIAIGANTDANQANAIAIGSSATNNGGAQANAINAIAIGEGALANSTNCIAIGKTVSVNGTLNNNIAIGQAISVTNVLTQNAVVIGNSCNSSARDTINIGVSNNTSADSAITIGESCIGGANQAIAMGFTSNSTGADGVAIGSNTIVSGANGIAIGKQANAIANAIVLNASGGGLTANQPGFFVDPIRQVANPNVLLYNSLSNEITFDTYPALTTFAQAIGYANNTTTALAAGDNELDFSSIPINPSAGYSLTTGNITINASQNPTKVGGNYWKINVRALLFVITSNMQCGLRFETSPDNSTWSLAGNQVGDWVWPADQGDAISTDQIINYPVTNATFYLRVVLNISTTGTASIQGTNFNALTTPGLLLNIERL